MPIRAGLLAAGVLSIQVATAQVPVAQTYDDPETSDQDDMCIWVHPSDPAKSALIASDKSAGKIVVYDLEGNTLDITDTPQPGNIDIRHGVEIDGACIDLVAFNERTEEALRVYRVDPASRTLERIDDGSIVTGDNYGFTLHRAADGRLYAHTGPKSSTTVAQYELVSDGAGMLHAVETGWTFQQSTIEGMASDDETGYLYLAEEAVGLWKVHATDAGDVTLIAEVGDASGMEADVEGVTIYYAAGGAGYIIASSQGADKFTVLDRQPPHAPVGEFTIDGVGSTDGIDVINMNLGPAYPQGLFAAHNGGDCCPVQTVRWNDIAAELGLIIDTDSWDPRGCEGTDPDPGAGAGGSGSASTGGGDATTAASGGALGAPPASTDSGCTLARAPGGGSRLILALVALLALGRRPRARGAASSFSCSCGS
jgi:3-phytase